MQDRRRGPAPQLEEYDRGRGTWRGTGERLPEGGAGERGGVARGAADTDVARDIELERQVAPGGGARVGQRARCASASRDGHEGRARRACRARTSPGCPAISSRPFERGRRGACAPHDRSDGGNFIRWSLRQVPEVQGAFMAMDVETGRVLAMQGGFSYQHSVFNRATQASGSRDRASSPSSMPRRSTAAIRRRPSSSTRRSRSTRRRGSGGRATRRTGFTARHRCAPGSNSRAT